MFKLCTDVMMGPRHMYERRKIEGGLESVEPRGIMCVYGRSRSSTRSKVEIVVTSERV